MEAWEGLVVDEDVLESFLKKCDASTSLIPGPARNVQATFINRISDDQHTTQQFAKEVAQAMYDRDFNSNAWKWAEMFVQHHELVPDGDMKNVNQLQSAKSVARLPLVACLIKECKSNGLGDMQLTLKVAIFGAFGRTHYLNIVLRNVVKVFVVDVCPPTKQLLEGTSKPVIRQPVTEEETMSEIMRKLVNQAHKPSTSKKPDNNTEQNPTPTNSLLNHIVCCVFSHPG
ncbi:hypothetical protein LR48_Vigan09g085300 [Vigna angularis]|uniref:Uncharacterized protein n=1 Tax=Phaseolus angularis TaxID=3914 RepID=A0A0L9VC05_PHAAN|nr:hypothetical protein LR48_Vigan09g085300 [Vigna angularis]